MPVSASDELTDADPPHFFQHFLVSSPRNEEKNALSEAYWVLEEVAGLDNPSITHLNVPGLSLLHGTLRNELSFAKAEEIGKNCQYCMKIIPLERYVRFDEEDLTQWFQQNAHRIQPKDRWRITVKKRHSKVKTRPLTLAMASALGQVGMVDLKHPDLTWQVEIIGGHVGLALLRPDQLFQTTIPDKAPNPTSVEDEFDG